MEIWDGYLQDGSFANVDLIRGEPIPRGLYHLVCEILVRHRDGDYLLMQRDFGKPKYGGLFEATAGGSALKGEDSLLCAKRELLEETGIQADSLEKIGHSISRNTIYDCYLCVTDCNKSAITLQEGETIAFKWSSEEDFIDFVNSGDMIPSQKLHLTDYFRKMGYLK